MHTFHSWCLLWNMGIKKNRDPVHQNSAIHAATKASPRCIRQEFLCTIYISTCARARYLAKISCLITLMILRIPHKENDTICMRVSRAFVVFGLASHLACVRSSVKNRHVSLEARKNQCGCRGREQIIIFDSGSRPIYQKNSRAGLRLMAHGIDLCGSRSPIRTARFAADEIAELLFAVGAQ